MNKRHSLWMAVTCLLVACVASVHAAERTYWRYSKGHFENTKGNQWEEKSPDGPHNFVETDRTNDYVELYDKSRDYTVRLYADHCTIRYATTGDKAFEMLYDGKWGGR